MSQRQLTFGVEGSGQVSALLDMPDSPIALLVLGHGAGADMRHGHMQAIAESLVDRKIAVLRYNFPFKESGGRRVDPMPVCERTIAAAISEAKRHLVDLPLLLGGHSFGGRMASHFAHDHPDGIAGLVYYSFPLHIQGKPATTRAAHLPGITCPQLFLSGSRDALAEPSLLHEVIAGLPNAMLHELFTADHGFRTLKRTRTDPDDVYTESAKVVHEFVASLPNIEMTSRPGISPPI